MVLEMPVSSIEENKKKRHVYWKGKRKVFICTGIDHLYRNKQYGFCLQTELFIRKKLWNL